VDAAFDSIVVKAESPKQAPAGAAPAARVSEPPEEIEPEPGQSSEADSVTRPRPAPEPVAKQGVEPGSAKASEAVDDLQAEMMRSIERLSAPPPPVPARPPSHRAIPPLPPPMPIAPPPPPAPLEPEAVTAVKPRVPGARSTPPVHVGRISTPQGLGPVPLVKLYSEPPAVPPDVLETPAPIPEVESVPSVPLALVVRTQPPPALPLLSPREREPVDFQRNVLRHGYFFRRGAALLLLVLVVCARPGWFNVGDLVLRVRTSAAPHASFHLPFLDR
jgi:hypothetical protein